jgi:TetR/AcrR family transcriptional regulator, lmrAB and yxaGH operons repressor
MSTIIVKPRPEPMPDDEDPKRKMISSAIELLARRGLQGTSFGEVLKHSGAPRGSVYHHFPGGKDELVAAAIDRVSERALKTLDAKAGSPATEIAATFLQLWREVLVRSNFEAGCSVLAVVVAAETPRLRERAAGIFTAWRERLADLLRQGGLPRTDASAMATLLVAACEGAVVLSRSTRSLEAFELVAAQLMTVVGKKASR